MKDVARKIAAEPVIGAWLLIWLVVAGLNFKAGVLVGGAGVDGTLVGLAFVSLAILGAYAAAHITGADKARRTGLTALICLQLAIGQWAGWQTLGINLSRGAAGFESKAGGHNTASDRLKAARAERAALGVQRPVATVAAERELECKITSKTFKDGKGPKCTKLVAEEENAKRAVALDALLPQLTAELAEGEQLTDANAAYSVAMALGSALGTLWHGKPVVATREDVIFWFAVFLTAALEFVGTCGPWLFGLREKWNGPQAPAPSALDLWDFGPPRLAALPLAPAGHGAPAAFGHPQPGADGLHRPQEPARLLSEPVPAPPPQTAEDKRAAQLDRIADRNVQKLKEVQFAPNAPDVPVDKAALNAVLDNLMVFMAACVEKQIGAMLPAADLYRRYEAWAQGRAIDPRAFHTLFPVAADAHLQQVGGVAHYSGLSLRQPRAIAS